LKFHVGGKNLTGMASTSLLNLNDEISIHIKGNIKINPTIIRIKYNINLKKFLLALVEIINLKLP